MVDDSINESMSPTLSIRSMASLPYCEGRYKCAPSGVPTGNNPWELDPAIDEAMQSALDVLYILVGMSR